MKINFDDNSKMNTALSLAERGRYADALLLFAQVNTYESLLNQIACLCGMEEDGYASDLYRQVKQKYGFTHAVYADAQSFGEVMSTVLNFCEPNRDYACRLDGTLRADPTLLAKVSYTYETDFYDDEPFSFFSTQLYSSAESFYDVTDPKYIFSLRAEFEDAMLDGDDQAIKNLYKTVMAFNRSDQETLELQLALITVRQKFKGKAALAIAQKYAEINSSNVMANGAAVEIILQNGAHKHLIVLRKLVRKLLKNADDVPVTELAELTFLANDVLTDAETAYGFAKALFAKRDSLTLDDYKVCATAFFNQCDRALAKDAILTLNRYVPHDKYVKFWLDFVDNAPYTTPFLQMGDKSTRHFFVPYGVMHFLNSSIGQKLFGETLSLDADAYRYVGVLFTYVKSLLISGENNKYQELCAYLRAMLHTIPPTDKQDFFDFATENLLTMVNDHMLNQTLITLLIELGFDKKVFVGLPESYQVVDFSEIPSDDQLLASSMGIALSITRVEVAQLVAAYNKLKPLVADEEYSLALAHNMAYAMLQIAKPAFSQTEDADFFVESEHELYERYSKFISKFNA